MAYSVESCHDQQGLEELAVDLWDRVELCDPEEAHEKTTDTCTAAGS